MAVSEENRGNHLRMINGAGQACFESPQSMKRNFRPFKNRTAETKENAPGNAEFALLKPKRTPPAAQKLRRNRQR